MSFFVSKELEQRVDENCLLDEPQKSTFTLSCNNSDFNIEEIIFQKSDNTLFATVSVMASLSSITSLIFEDCCVEIKLVNKKVKVARHKIIKLKRHAEDNYLLAMTCILEKGFVNV